MQKRKKKIREENFAVEVPCINSMPPCLQPMWTSECVSLTLSRVLGVVLAGLHLGWPPCPHHARVHLARALRGSTSTGPTIPSHGASARTHGGWGHHLLVSLLVVTC